MRTEYTFTYTKFAASIFIFVCTFNLNSIDAQSLRGKVFDQYKIPLIGAYIENINSDHPHHTHSRELGDFILEDVHLGDTLQVTFFGFEKDKTLNLSILSRILTLRLIPFNLLRKFSAKYPVYSSDNMQEGEKQNKFSYAVSILIMERTLQLR